MNVPLTVTLYLMCQIHRYICERFNQRMCGKWTSHLQ